LHAATILDACAAARACPRMLPHRSALSSVASGPAAALTYKLWQSMHLQGLGATHELPLAPCAHFMYKKRARIDYSRHPLLSSSALGDEQRRSLALLTMLVSTDVEHRIIPPTLCTRIMTLLHDATAVDSTEQGRQDASTTASMSQVWPTLPTTVAGTRGRTFGGPRVIAKKHLLMVSLPARPSVRAPTAAAMSVPSKMLPATRAATSTSRLSAGPATTTTRPS